MKFILLCMVLLATPALAQRTTDQLVALYDFTEGVGSVVIDRVGSLDLTIETPSNVQWITDGGIMISSPTRIESQTNATNIFNACIASNAISIEGWIMPLVDTASGPARIISVAVDGGAVGGNFVIGQDQLKFENRLRTTTSDKYGKPALVTGDIVSISSVQHIVFTKTSGGVTNFYIDGTQHNNGIAVGDFSTWIDATLTLANESITDRPWLGTMHLIAIYSKALSPLEVVANYNAGYTSTPIPPTYNPEIDARGLWDAPIGGIQPTSYYVEYSLNGTAWTPYATTDLLSINLRITFFDGHRIRVAGVDAFGGLGPFSEPSDVYFPSSDLTHPPGKPEHTEE